MASSSAFRFFAAVSPFTVGGRRSESTSEVFGRSTLPAEAGAVLVQALGAALEDLGDASAPPAKDVPAETPSDLTVRDPSADEPFAARRADALCHLAEQFLANGPVASDSASAERHQIVVHVDPPALRAEGEYARCDLDTGPALAPETARRRACDASVVPMAADADNAPLDAGRRSRTVPPALRRFLRERDGGCRFPGCTQHRHVDAHHIRHWADGGATRADNLVLLCRQHHRLVHEGGFGLERRPGGQLVFTDPRGRRLDHAPTPPQVTMPLAAHVAACHVNVSAETLVPAWRGRLRPISWLGGDKKSFCARKAVSPESNRPATGDGFGNKAGTTPNCPS